MTPEQEEQAYLERLERAQKGLRDQYNTTENVSALAYAEQKLLSCSADYAIHDQETLEQYIYKLKAHITIGFTKNTNCHIKPAKGAWYTHRDPRGCFMCEDQNLIHYMFQIISILAEKHPKLILRP